MIICSCNVISDHDIKEAVRKLKNADPNAILTPGKVYNAMNKKAQCGICLQNTISVILHHDPEAQISKGNKGSD